MTLEDIKELRKLNGDARNDHARPTHHTASYVCVINLLWLLDRLYIEYAYLYGRSYTDVANYERRIKPKEPNPDLTIPQAEDL